MITGSYLIDITISLVNAGQIRLIQTKYALKISGYKYPSKIEHIMQLSSLAALIAVCVPYLLLPNQNWYESFKMVLVKALGMLGWLEELESMCSMD